MLEYEVPASARLSERMERRFQGMEKQMAADIPNHRSIAGLPGAVTFMRDGNRKFERCDGVWTERKRIRNPDYVKPPVFLIVYGISEIPQGGCFFCKFPPGMRSRDMLSAVTKVANSYGYYARTKGANRFLLMGCDQALWDNNGVVGAPRYEWNGQELAPVGSKKMPVAPTPPPVVTCVYCGHEYPEGTPTAKHELLTAHIKVCENHPMREAEATISDLRTALLNLLEVTPSATDFRLLLSLCNATREARPELFELADGMEVAQKAAKDLLAKVRQNAPKG